MSVRAPERYALTKACAVALSAVVAAYGFLGWLYEGELFKAVLCLLAQAVAINATIAARRAFEKEIPFTGFVGVAFAAAAAGFSEQGLHHAWTAGLHIEALWPLKLSLGEGGEISPVLTWALCIIEPGLFWFAERVEMTARPKTADELVNEALGDFRGDTHRGDNNIRRPEYNTQSSRKTEQERDGLAPPTPRPRERTTPRRDATAGRRGPPGRGDRARAFAMMDAGATAGEAHRATGVPLSTCKGHRKRLQEGDGQENVASLAAGDGLKLAA